MSLCVCVSLARVVLFCLAPTHTAPVSSPSLWLLFPSLSGCVEAQLAECVLCVCVWCVCDCASSPSVYLVVVHGRVVVLAQARGRARRCGMVRLAPPEWRHRKVRRPRRSVLQRHQLGRLRAGGAEGRVG